MKAHPGDRWLDEESLIARYERLYGTQPIMAGKTEKPILPELPISLSLEAKESPCTTPLA